MKHRERTGDLTQCANIFPCFHTPVTEVVLSFIIQHSYFYLPPHEWVLGSGSGWLEHKLSVLVQPIVRVPTHQVVYKAWQAPSAFFPNWHFTRTDAHAVWQCIQPSAPPSTSSLHTFLLLPLRSLTDTTPLLPIVILHLFNSLSPFSHPDPWQDGKTPWPPHVMYHTDSLFVGFPKSL